MLCGDHVHRGLQNAFAELYAYLTTKALKAKIGNNSRETLPSDSVVFVYFLVSFGNVAERKFRPSMRFCLRISHNFILSAIVC